MPCSVPSSSLAAAAAAAMAIGRPRPRALVQSPLRACLCARTHPARSFTSSSRAAYSDKVVKEERKADTEASGTLPSQASSSRGVNGSSAETAPRPAEPGEAGERDSAKPESQAGPSPSPSPPSPGSSSPRNSSLESLLGSLGLSSRPGSAPSSASSARASTLLSNALSHPSLVTFRAQLRTRLDALDLQSRGRLAELGARWNKFSGYEQIEELKDDVVRLEARLQRLRSAASAAKASYTQAVASRSSSQRETNDLLQRKASWSDADLSRYTSLIRAEHAEARAEARAEEEAALAEREVEKGFDELMRGVMRRYHEEQVWSDRVRSASTYGSLFVVGLNVLVFMAAILFVEPYKRRKLAQTFEQRLLQGEAQGRALVQSTIENFEQRIVAGLYDRLEEMKDRQAVLMARAGVSVDEYESERERQQEQKQQRRGATRALKNELLEREEQNQEAGEQVDRFLAQELGFEQGGIMGSLSSSSSDGDSFLQPASEDDESIGFAAQGTRTQTTSPTSPTGGSTTPNTANFKQSDDDKDKDNDKEFLLAGAAGAILGAALTGLVSAFWGL